METPAMPAAIPAGTPLPAALSMVATAASAVEDPAARTAAQWSVLRALTGRRSVAAGVRMALGATLRDRLAAGATQATLASELGVSRQLVGQLAHDPAVARPRYTSAQRAARVATARARHAAGDTLVDIADDLGVTRQTAARWVHGR